MNMRYQNTRSCTFKP